MCPSVGRAVVVASAAPSCTIISISQFGIWPQTLLEGEARTARQFTAGFGHQPYQSRRDVIPTHSVRRSRSADSGPRVPGSWLRLADKAVRAPCAALYKKKAGFGSHTESTPKPADLRGRDHSRSWKRLIVSSDRISGFRRWQSPCRSLRPRRRPTDRTRRRRLGARRCRPIPA